MSANVGGEQMNIDKFLSKFIHQDIYILTDEDIKELIKLIEEEK